MSYETDHDFTWVSQALRPRGQVPGQPPQELPNVVVDTVRPTFDALAWARYSEVVHETANAVNVGTIALPAAPSGFNKLYIACNVRAQGGASADNLWIALREVATALQSGLTEPHPGPDGEATSQLRRHVVVPPGFQLIGRSRNATGIGVTFLIEGFFIQLPVGEYVFPV